jgi:hypothetical protein
MATATKSVKSEGKSGFLTKFFAGHRDAGKGAIDAAWQAAGNEETLRKARRILVRSHEG